MADTRKVTFEVIAEKAGVSVSTVSLALRAKSNIPPETRQHVQEIAKNLGYMPKPPTWRNSRTELTNIGLIIKTLPKNPQDNPFYSVVQSGIELACRENHINLLYASLPVDQDSRITQVPRMLLEDHVNGLLVVGLYLNEANAQIFERQAVPTVLVDAYAASNAYDAIVSANFRGAYEAVSYLIKRGHQHIGIVGSHPNCFPSIADRRLGYIQALQDHDIAERYFIDSTLESESAFAATSKHLESGSPITAIFGANDKVAIWAMRAAKELGRRIPADLSFVGFDDDLLAAHVEPALTTIHVDKVGMGRLAVSLLINRIEHPEAGLVETVLRTRLIERKSVLNLGG